MNKMIVAIVAFAGTANAQLLTITADNNFGTITASGDQALNDFVQSGTDPNLFRLVSFFRFGLEGSFSNVAVASAYAAGDGFDAATDEVNGFSGFPPLNPVFTPGDLNPVLATYSGELTAVNVIGTLDGSRSTTSPFFSGTIGNPFLYQTALGEAADIAFEVVIIPAPASAALLGLAGLAGIRRR